VSGLDSSPNSKIIRTYLLAAKVEGKSPLTLEAYGQKLMLFARFLEDQLLGNPPLTQINNTHIRSFFLYLQDKKLSPATLNSYYRALKTFFNWLVMEGMLDKIPFNNIKPPRVPRMIPKPFSNQDITELLNLCTGNNFLALRNRALVLLFLDTGLRLNEMANIKIVDVNFEGEVITVMGKGAKQRVVRMGKEAQKALLKYLLMRNDNLPCLWLTEEHRPLKKSGIQIAMRRLSWRAGITDAKPGPHTFRHSFATQSLRNGAGSFFVQALLGHSTLSTTKRYVSSLNSEDAVIAHRAFSPVDNLKIS
jgi:site-specific recombinase XerD